MQNTFFASGEPPYVRTVWERRFALICLRPSLPTARSRASNRYIEKEADPLKQNTICYVAEVDSQVVGVSLGELLFAAVSTAFSVIWSACPYMRKEK